MKTDLLLIAEHWDESSAIIAEAANRTGHGFRHLNCKRARELLASDTAGIDLVIVDVDPKYHDFSLVDVIVDSEELPPVMVIARGDAVSMKELARRHGAAAFVEKPFTVLDMEWAIDELRPCPEPLPTSCDIWGHPRSPRKRVFCR